MPNPLNNVVCGDGYTDAATISEVWNSNGGSYYVAGAGVYVQFEYGQLGSPYWTGEQLLGDGAVGTLDSDTVGVRFRNAVAGSSATVTASIANGDEPALNLVNLGTVVVAAPAGTLLKVSYLASGTTVTTGASTNQVRARLVGAGGGGANGGGANQAGSGGGAGAYTDTGLLSVSPATAYTYQIGAAGTHGNAPTAGTATTLTIGALTYQAGGGAGGANGAGYTLGGAGGIGVTNGAGVTFAGEQGGASVTFNAATQAIGGRGGSSLFGGGGPGAMGTGVQVAGAATGYGSGGGGGVWSAGGNGTDGKSGLIILEEYA